MYEKGHEDEEETVDKPPDDPGTCCYGSRMWKEEYTEEIKDRRF